MRQRLCGKGRFDHAISDYDLAIKSVPSFSKPFDNHGVAFLKTGDYDSAIKDFDEAIKLTPDYARALANRAEANQKRHDYRSSRCAIMIARFVFRQV